MHPAGYLLPVAAYLYGSVPFGFLAAKLLKGIDIRRTGSGNIGATNAARVLGRKYFPPIFLLDFSKGCLPTLAAGALFASASYDPHPMVVLTGLAAVLGHVFSIYLSFRGGKGVATCAGVFAVLAPLGTLVGLAAWAAVFAGWRYVSLASICAMPPFLLCVYAFSPEPLGRGIFLALLASASTVLVIFLHRTNIKHLLSGTEPKVGRLPPTEDDPGPARLYRQSAIACYPEGDRWSALVNARTV